MPVRSVSWSLLKWPTLERVDTAVRAWARDEAECRLELVALGRFGSYARGDWDVGSDLDLVAIVDKAEEPFESRGVSWDLTDFLVPAEILVSTEEEWKRLQERGGRFPDTLGRETVWLFERHRAPRCRRVRRAHQVRSVQRTAH